MRPSTLLLLLLLLALSSSASLSHALTGGWAPIKNLTDPHVVEIGEFAVSEHNKEANVTLGFGRVIRGETQVVAGTNYKLIIETTNDVGAKGNTYEAVVWEKEWVKFRKLVSFKPLQT